jgi:hypothetical protein
MKEKKLKSSYVFHGYFPEDFLSCFEVLYGPGPNTFRINPDPRNCYLLTVLKKKNYLSKNWILDFTSQYYGIESTVTIGQTAKSRIIKTFSV